MSDSPRVSRRRVLGAIATVGGASSAVGAGTMALFSDTESSSGNTIQAGTVELDIGGSGSFDFSASLAPTQETAGTVTLVNSGSIQGSVDVDVTANTESDASPNDQDVTAQEVAQNLEVTALTYGGSDITSQISANSSPPTLDELANNLHDGTETTQNDLINLADPTSGGTDFSITLRLKDVGNEFQSDGVQIDFTFHLNQTDAQ